MLADIPAASPGFWPTFWILTGLGSIAALSAGLWIPIWAALKWIAWVAIGAFTGRSWREARQDSRDYVVRPKRGWFIYVFQFVVFFGATGWLQQQAPDIYSGAAIYGGIAAYLATVLVLKILSLRPRRRQHFARFPVESKNLSRN
jgi:hypothetical protein